jgi:Fe-Mn family superoxide dismutase
VDFALRPLPYPVNALEPYVGAETLRLHREQHHAVYLHQLERRIGRSPRSADSLPTILATPTGSVFELAAQVWSHEFLWQSMKPRGGGHPGAPLAGALVRSFGSVDGFRRLFRMEAAEHFGAGWVWLVVDRGRLRVITTGNGELPLTRGQAALVALDLWEHAYYLDYRNERKRYVEAFLEHLIDWDFVAANLEAEPPRAPARAQPACEVEGA